MTLTANFLMNHQGFMSTHAILIPAQVPANNGRFKLTAQGANAALVEASNQNSDINGFYVHPVANNNNIYILPTQQPDTYYMLTDGMNGCQFIAYGPDRQHITVEHNNFINNAANYTTRLNYIANQNFNYFFHISAGTANNIPNGAYIPMQGINIIGEYRAVNGWRFWVRDRVDQNQGNIYGPF